MTSTLEAILPPAYPVHRDHLETLKNRLLLEKELSRHDLNAIAKCIDFAIEYAPSYEKKENGHEKKRMEVPGWRKDTRVSENDLRRLYNEANGRNFSPGNQELLGQLCDFVRRANSVDDPEYLAKVREAFPAAEESK